MLPFRRLLDGLGRRAWPCIPTLSLPHNQDLDVKNAEVREAQRQQAECHRRLQLAEGELAVVRKKLEEVEGEKTHMDQQLVTYIKDFEEERKATQERELVMSNHEKSLSDATRENINLTSRCNAMSAHITKVARYPPPLPHTPTPIFTVGPPSF